MTDAPDVYVDTDSAKNAEADGLAAPYGDNTWRVVVEDEGVVAYVGSLELASLIRDAIRKDSRTFKVGDHIRTLYTRAVLDYGLPTGMRGVIISVEGARIGFLTHTGIEGGTTYPWWAQAEHIELDK